MKRKLITFIIIIVCFLLECTVFHRLSFASVKPKLEKRKPSKVESNSKTVESVNSLSIFTK